MLSEIIEKLTVRKAETFFSGAILRLVIQQFTDVLEECTASIFRDN
jgi:hypothetical protein